MVSAWWASGLSAPTLIAETTNRRTIERASSTSASGTGVDAWRTTQLVARDGAVGAPAGERRPVARQLRRRCRPAPCRRSAAARAVISVAIRRREEVGLAVGAEAREAGVRQARLAPGRGLGDGQRRGAAAELAVGQVGEGRPAGPRRRGREAARDDRRVEVDDVDQRAADVRGDGADAHPGERLAQAGLEGRDDAAGSCRPA